MKLGGFFGSNRYSKYSFSISYLSSKGILGTIGNCGIQSGSGINGINFGTFLEQSDRIKGVRDSEIGSWCGEQFGLHI